MISHARLTQAPDSVPSRAGYGGLIALVALIASGVAASAYLTVPHGGFPRVRGADDLNEHPAPIARMPFDARVPDASDRNARRRALQRFAWADPRHRTVRVPIEDAMRIVVEEAHR